MKTPAGVRNRNPGSFRTTIRATAIAYQPGGCLPTPGGSPGAVSRGDSRRPALRPPHANHARFDPARHGHQRGVRGAIPPLVKSDFLPVLPAQVQDGLAPLTGHVQDAFGTLQIPKTSACIVRGDVGLAV